MPLISLETRINAPVEKVFDLARNIQVHCQTAAWTNERVVEEAPPKKPKEKPKLQISLGKKKETDAKPPPPAPEPSPVRKRASPLLEKGESVTFEAKHLGKVRRLTSRVTHMEPPFSFTDKMIKGPFKAFTHQHNFQGMPDGTTVMSDIVEYTAPGGPLISDLIDRMVLEKYMREYITRRTKAFKQLAEKDSEGAPAPEDAARSRGR